MCGKSDAAPKVAGTRREAELAGYRYYATRAPCRNGHLSFRYTASGYCVECVCDRVKRHYKTHTEACLARSRTWNRAHSVGAMKLKAAEADMIFEGAQT